MGSEFMPALSVIFIVLGFVIVGWVTIRYISRQSKSVCLVITQEEF